MTIYDDLALGSDHLLLNLRFEYTPSTTSSTSIDPPSHRKLWNLSRLTEEEPLALLKSTFVAQTASLKSHLTALTQNPPSTCPAIDELNATLNSHIYTAMDSAIGSKRQKPAHWKKYWTEDLQQKAQQHDRQYYNWRFTPAVDTLLKLQHWTLYLEAQKSFRRAVKAAKRLSWKNSSTTFTHPDGPQAAVDIMSEHLSTVYNGDLLRSATRPTAPTPPSHLPFTVYDDLDLFQPEQLAELIRQLPNRKAPGADHLKAEILKALVSELAPIYSMLFTLCYQWSYTPRLWRQADVFPIHKKGDATNPANYRPISLTSVVRKLFEISLSACLTTHSPPLDIAQGGFRPQRSPLDQALCLHDLMHDYFLHHHHYPVVAFLDIKSAYDTVDRRVIWSALQQSTLPPPVLGLLVNLFDDVEISVLIANHRSQPFQPATGVLQGSVLSPHLYSLYINSLPALLRSTASASTTTVLLPGEDSPVALNCLLFADDVAILGSKTEVADMLSLAADHSLRLGYRWNPAKCAVLNAPSPTSSTSTNFQLSLYGEPLPTTTDFTYLGMPFHKKGLNGSGILATRSASAIKTMALLTSVGVNRCGFSLLLCSRLYTSFIRPKFEYGLAISRLTVPDLKGLDKLQNRLIGMFIGSKWFNVAKHITCIPSMQHRYNVLVTRYVLRAETLPQDCLLSLLPSTLRYPRLVKLLQCNALYQSLPSPAPASTALRRHFQEYWQDTFDRQMHTAAARGTQVLLRACRPCSYKPDPILYLPMSRTARSRLVRWRLGRFTNMNEECPCMSGARISRDHFAYDCNAIDATLFDALPVAPIGVNPIDHALNCLPVSSASGPPSYWTSLLDILYTIDTLSHPLATIRSEPDPGDQWYLPASSQ